MAFGVMQALLVTRTVVVQKDSDASAKSFCGVRWAGVVGTGEIDWRDYGLDKCVQIAKVNSVSCSLGAFDNLTTLSPAIVYTRTRRKLAAAPPTSLRSPWSMQESQPDAVGIVPAPRPKKEDAKTHPTYVICTAAGEQRLWIQEHQKCRCCQVAKSGLNARIKIASRTQCFLLSAAGGRERTDE